MMPMRQLGLAVVLAWLAGGAFAGPLSTELSHTQEQLTAGRADWRSDELLATWRDPTGWTAYGALRRTERFDLVDRQIEAGVGLALAPQWHAEVELTHSNTHQVLPQTRLSSRLWRQDVGGWNLALGGGRTVYRSAGSRQGSAVVELQAERYVGDFRLVWAGSMNRLDGGGSAGAHLWRMNWYPNDRWTLGTLLAFGRELENLPGTGLVATRVRGAAFSARWSMTPVWALSAELSTQRQGDLFERHGLRLGLRYNP